TDNIEPPGEPRQANSGAGPQGTAEVGSMATRAAAIATAARLEPPNTGHAAPQPPKVLANCGQVPKATPVQSVRSRFLGAEPAGFAQNVQPVGRPSRKAERGPKCKGSFRWLSDLLGCQGHRILFFWGRCPAAYRSPSGGCVAVSLAPAAGTSVTAATPPAWKYAVAPMCWYSMPARACAR